MLRKSLAALAACLALHGANARGDDSPRIANAWVRATAPGQTITGAFLEVTSPVRATIVSAESDAAGSAEIHLSAMENGVMRMREVEKVSLPANQAVKFAPGGYHIMLIDLKKTLVAGDKLPLALTFERPDKSKSQVTFDATVRAIGDEPGAHRK